MYEVSQEFLDALHSPARFERVRGTVGNQTFDDSNILSMSYSNRCSDTADVTFGSAYIGLLEATFVGIDIFRGDWRGQVITLEWGLVLEDESVEYIPIGIFTVTEANWSSSGISIKASDNIAKLDRNCAATGTNGTIHDLMSLVALECGLVLGQSAADYEAMPNGDELFGLYPNNDIKTWRDFASWVAQLAGGFIYAGRDGKLYLKSFEDLTSADALTAREREHQSVFSDYSTVYQGISVVNIAEQTTSYYNYGEYGTVINLGSNPFLQYGTDEAKTRQRLRIAEVADSVRYTPFTSSVLSSMVYDLGDILTCTGGIAGTSALDCCIMQIEWISKSLTQLQGFGSDPALTSGKSKTDKELSGLISKTSENEVAFYTFENAQEFILGEDEIVPVITIRFATITPKMINLWHEIDLQTTANPEGDGVITCQAFYYLDGQLISYSPITTWNNDGWHLLHLLYFLQSLEGGRAYEWEVRLKMSGGTATISIGDIHASLYGQGLVAADSWPGVIDIDREEYDLIGGGSGATFGYSDSVDFDWLDVDTEDISDTYNLVGVGGATFGYSDSVDIHTQKNKYNIVSADGQYGIASADGEYYLDNAD